MKCDFCNKIIDDDVKFCPYCGNSFVEEKKEIVVNDVTFTETAELSLTIKIYLIVSALLLILSFIPRNIQIPFIVGVLSLLMIVINIFSFVKTKNKYNIFIVILCFTLLLTNINSIVLYLILK